MKFSGKVRSAHGMTRLHFLSIPEKLCDAVMRNTGMGFVVFSQHNLFSMLRIHLCDMNGHAR